jgi:uncharacterized protein YbjT (DUF2867 family)
MILVTGATGTVGREVVAQWLPAGKAVRVLVQWMRVHAEAFA